MAVHNAIVMSFELYTLVFVLESESNHRKKDVDHRNLISLTGSPKENNPPKIWKGDIDQVIFSLLIQIVTSNIYLLVNDLIRFRNLISLTLVILIVNLTFQNGQ